MLYFDHPGNAPDADYTILDCNQVGLLFMDVSDSRMPGFLIRDDWPGVDRPLSLMRAGSASYGTSLPGSSGGSLTRNPNKRPINRLPIGGRTADGTNTFGDVAADMSHSMYQPARIGSQPLPDNLGLADASELDPPCRTGTHRGSAKQRRWLIAIGPPARR
jgi:hypothetical protein